MRQIHEDDFSVNFLCGEHRDVLGRVGQHRIPAGESRRDVFGGARLSSQPQHVVVVTVRRIHSDWWFRLRIDDKRNQVTGFSRTFDQDDLWATFLDNGIKISSNRCGMMPYGKPVELIAEYGFHLLLDCVGT